MAGYPILSRVTDSRMTADLQSTLQKSMQAIARAEGQIASGQMYRDLADAPLVTRRLVSGSRFLERNEKIATNINLATQRLSASESALSEIQTLVIKAREIALTQIDGSSTAETREDASVEVSFLIDEIITLANRQFGERNLFGGTQVSGQVFERTGNYVSYLGDDGGSKVEIAPGMFTEDAVSGVEAFGAWSTEIQGRNDLDPIITPSTVLSSLNNGRGIGSGPLEIRDGLGVEFVDISGASTVGDIIDAVNASGFATASIDASSTGIQITKTPSSFAIDTTGMTSAADLVAALQASSSVAVASFAGGDSVQLHIDGAPAAFTVDLSSATSVADVISAIDAHSAVSATLSGSTLSVSTDPDLSIFDVNGGSAASDLGINIENQGTSLAGRDLDPTIRWNTLLSELRGGAGISAGTFDISNGTLGATIDTTGLETVEDLINAIDRSGTGVFARVNEAGTGVDVLSTLSGAVLRITEGSGTTADELGFITPSADLPMGQLNGGLGVGSVDGADLSITLASGTSFDIDVSSAATLGDVASLINAHASNGGELLAEVVAGEDRLRLTETSGATGELSVTVVNGSFAADNLGIRGDSTGGVLEGGDLSPGGHRVNSVFDGFTLLYEGLLNGSEAELSRALDALDLAQTNVLHTRADVGTTMRRLEISDRRTQLEIAETEQMLSIEGDTDLASTILEFQREQTVLQATMQTASRILQQSILDFLG